MYVRERNAPSICPTEFAFETMNSSYLCAHSEGSDKTFDAACFVLLYACILTSTSVGKGVEGEDKVSTRGWFRFRCSSTWKAQQLSPDQPRHKKVGTLDPFSAMNCCESNYTCCQITTLVFSTAFRAAICAWGIMDQYVYPPYNQGDAPYVPQYAYNPYSTPLPYQQFQGPPQHAGPPNNVRPSLGGAQDVLTPQGAGQQVFTV